MNVDTRRPEDSLCCNSNSTMTIRDFHGLAVDETPVFANEVAAEIKAKLHLTYD